MELDCTPTTLTPILGSCCLAAHFVGFRLVSSGRPKLPSSSAIPHLVIERSTLPSGRPPKQLDPSLGELSTWASTRTERLPALYRRRRTLSSSSSCALVYQSPYACPQQTKSGEGMARRLLLDSHPAGLPSSSPWGDSSSVEESFCCFPPSSSATSTMVS